jgi:peptidoglycan L-alanyl-D-glutamate endopeptidase CwlK
MPDVLATSRIHRLVGVHPRLVEAVKRICYAMHELGFAMLVTDGVRTTAQQQALYAQGRSAAGAIITKADGVTTRSNHQAKADGFGHAVDLCFLVDGKASWNEQLPWALYGAMAKSQGLVWGGTFTTISDRPHIELPKDFA